MEIIFSLNGLGIFTPDPLKESPIQAVLVPNNWDDYSYKTLFSLTVSDSAGNVFNLGDVKIGYTDQPHGWTREVLPQGFFLGLGEGFFSLGQDVSYYKKIYELPGDLRSVLLTAMRDVVHDTKILAVAEASNVFHSSLMRSVSRATIDDQYRRILNGGAVLTKFNFGYDSKGTESNAPFHLTFDVDPSNKPSTNIHVLIGRNGVGKTKLLNGMISALVTPDLEGNLGTFHNRSGFLTKAPITSGYFSGLISISFSAFDPFNPPADNVGNDIGINYSYIGLKQIYKEEDSFTARPKNQLELCDEFLSSLRYCLNLSRKRESWIRAISFLESDQNFADMDLVRLCEIKENGAELGERARQFFKNMSSGHAIILLTITKLVERTQEKTLVLIDEPESHLHPPLLSAFVRAISDLLSTHNGVAIIATHSPVVLQEVPKSCVWKLRRSKLIGHTDRPKCETFGENVGILTREVFQLEVIKSGFYSMLNESVEVGKSFEEILIEFEGQIGFEGRAILQALIANKNNDAGVS